MKGEDNMDTKRMFAWIIDFAITCIIQTILMSLFLIKPLMEISESVNIFNIIVRQLILTYCSMSFMIIRDIIGKKSIGKIVMKLKIINKNDGTESDITKRFIRNITWLLGPIDIIIFLSTKERLGDKIVGTKIIENN